MNRHTAQIARTNRRGSALLIVIGILALVAVLGAIYISIGQADTQSARAVTQRADNEAASFEVGSFLANTVALDRFDTYLIPSNGANSFNIRSAREAWDYPFTDFSVRSQKLSGVQDYELFNPPGRHTEIAPGLQASNDTRTAYDPWLASTEPEYLGPEELAPNTGVTFQNGRVFSNNRIEGYWLDRRDWWQISNFAEDGRFVNLFNLRPEANPFGGEVGGFDALAGTGDGGSGTYADPETGRARAAMTNQLTLIRPFQTNGVETTLQAFDPRSQGVWLPGADQPYQIPGIGAGELYNTPAVWTMFQRYMFFPMNQEFIMRDRSGQVADWSSPDYPPYQYADADGDGMADSRWAELVDASDPDNIIELDGDADYRVFFAARAMDLSALVNLNTAGDLLFTPTVEQPYGLSLTEIDLRRLLTMSDQAFDWSPRNLGNNQPYVPASWQVPGQLEGLSLSNLDFPIEDKSGQALGGDPVQTYRPSVRGFRDSDGFPASGFYNRFPDYTQTDLVAEAEKLFVGEAVGAYAYDALRLAIERELPLDARFYGMASDAFAAGTEPAEDYRLLTSSHFSFDYDAIGAPDRLASGTLWTSEQEKGEHRLDYFEQVGLLDVSRSEDRVSGTADFGAALFTLDDLGEMLTYRGVNDPAVTTRLEQTMMGRAGDGAQFSRDTTRRLSPLLSNRSLSFDRFGHGDGRLRGSNNGRGFPDVRGQIDPESMALFALSPRLRLTTFNGAAPLVPALAVNATDTELGTGDVISRLSRLATNPGGLFDLFGAALVPYPSINGDVTGETWFNDVSQAATNTEQSTLNYGHVSGELAWSLAAHLAVNSADFGDDNRIPSAATLVMDERGRDEVDNELGDDVDQRIFPWAEDRARLDPGIGATPGGTGGSSLTDELRHARNVFGVEAQPFLIEASSLVVFSDTPEGPVTSGDGDYRSLTAAEARGLISNAQNGNQNDPRAPDISAIPNITINTARAWDGNGGPKDMMLQLIAFKLTNPFNRDVTLGTPTWNEDENRWENFDYYIEYGGRFFLLAEFVEFDEGRTDQPTNGDGFDDFAEFVPVEEQLQPITISAGGTRVLYCLANNDVGHSQLASQSRYDFREADERWAAAMGFTNPDGYHTGGSTFDSDPVTGPAWEWVNRQLRIPGGGGPVRIKEFDPESGELRRRADTLTIGTAGNQVWRDLFTPVPETAAVDVTRRNQDRVKTNVVRLWRSLRATNLGETDNTSVPNNAGVYNVVENDLLADRLSAPVDAMGNSPKAYLDAIEPVAARGNGAVEGTMSYQPGLPVASNACTAPVPFEVSGGSVVAATRNDNTGWTLALWGTIRRPDAGDQPEFGELPEWALEVRHPEWSGTDSATTTFVNVARRWDDDPGFGGRAGLSAFANGGFEAADFAVDCNRAEFTTSTKSFETPVFVRGDLNNYFSHNEVQPSMDDFQSLGGAKRVMYALTRVPGDDSSAGDPRFEEVEQKYDLNKQLGPNVANESLFAVAGGLEPEAFIADGFDNDSMRPADLLLAMGVGPVQAPNPDRAGNPNFAFDPDEEWLTLSEMLAIALGFDVPLEHSTADEPARRLDDPYYGIVNNWADTDGNGTPGEPTDYRYVLPNARLAIDDFVSYFDDNTNRAFDPPTLGGVTDVRAGSGIPMALDVIGRVRLHEPKEPLSNPGNEELTRVVPGTININTAPASTLRLLPGLSPSFQSFQEPDGLGGLTPLQPEWWVSRVSSTGGTEPLDLRDYQNSPDIAASIVAYRDRLKPLWRRASHPDLNGASVNASEVEFRFDPDNDLYGFNDFGDLVGSNFAVDTTRGNTTGLAGIRENPGFRSTGELLAVTVAEQNPDGTDNTNLPFYRHNSIQVYGLDGAEAELIEIEDAAGSPTGEFAAIESGAVRVGSRYEADTLTDDLGEKLALANNVLGSITVSSDVYAVWYVVHGYRESDVSDLRPGDPLVPSYARRFVMVLDRSNVTKEGDAPRIVYLREVPM